MITEARRFCAILWGFLVLMTCAPASAQNSERTLPSTQDIDVYVEDGIALLGIPGAAMAVIEDGEITYIHGFGRIDANGEAVTAQTPFQIASLTKSFTSLVVLQLAAEGRLSIDDPVVKHIPYFRTSDPALSGKITIRHLMDHRSGLTMLDGNRYQRTEYRGSDATERAVRKLSSAKLHAAPGGRYQYSNANYATLAHLIEAIEQMPYEDVMEARIFSKIGMVNTFVQKTDNPTAKEAQGHLQWFRVPREDHFIAGRMMMGAGGIVTSAEDLAKYLIAVSEADPRIVPAALVRSWEAEPELAYEFGWQRGTFDGRPVIFHDGANPGFRAAIMYEPGASKGALFLMNMSGTHEGSLHHGATRYALGLAPVSISPYPFFGKLLWGSFFAALTLGLLCLFSIRRLLRNQDKPWYKSSLLRWILIIFPSTCLVAFAFALWFYVPRSFGVNFAASSLFYPDLGALQLAQIIIALVWASARTVLLLKRMRF